MSKLTKFFIVLILAVSAIVYVFWTKNIYSKEVLKLEILGSRETTLGQEIEYVVKYKNNGNFRLENPVLIFEPPDFSLSDDKIFERTVLDSEKLGGAIYPGEERTFSFKMRLLGKEGDTKIANASLTYQPKNLKARYESKTSFTTIITSVPFTFEFDLPSKIEANKNFRFRLNYSSNIDWILTNLRAQMDYPAGFEFIESTPRSLDKTEWDIPVLNKDQAGSVDIMGRLEGNLGEAKIFKARVGIWKEGEFIMLKETEKGVEIVKPSVSIRQEINGNPKYVARPGDWLHYEIYFKNISDEEQYNLFMINKLEGDLYDFNAIKSETGNFQSGDSSIVFDWRKVPKLQYLALLEEGKVEFWIKLKDDLSNIKNPVLRNRILIGPAREDYVTKISSKIEIVQKGYYNDEIFGNSGPMPPVVGEETTFTINWQAKNYYSDVKNIKIKATLPEYVEFSGKVFPDSEKDRFSYNEDSREIIWRIDELRTGQGVLTPPPNVSFQITLVPKPENVGEKPQLIGTVLMEGDDSWTDIVLEAEAAAIDTASLSEENMDEEKSKVRDSKKNSES